MGGLVRRKEYHANIMRRKGGGNSQRDDNNTGMMVQKCCEADTRALTVLPCSQVSAEGGS
eukprot:1161028-Pelagomonas_calceolata.AAC.4